MEGWTGRMVMRHGWVHLYEYIKFGGSVRYVYRWCISILVLRALVLDQRPSSSANVIFLVNFLLARLCLGFAVFLTIKRLGDSVSFKKFDFYWKNLAPRVRWSGKNEVSCLNVHSIINVPKLTCRCLPFQRTKRNCRGVYYAIALAFYTCSFIQNFKQIFWCIVQLESKI
jgi:hypothetical protein